MFLQLHYIIYLFSDQEDKTSGLLEDIELDAEYKPPIFILTNEFTYIP